MVQMGVIRAEGVSATTTKAEDKIVIQRFDTNMAQYTPMETTIGGLLGGSGGILAVGTATLVAGEVVVTITNAGMRGFSASSKVFITVNGAPTNTYGYTIQTLGGTVTITSSSGSDTAVVSYLVFA